MSWQHHGRLEVVRASLLMRRLMLKGTEQLATFVLLENDRMRIVSPDSVLSQSIQISLAPTCQWIRRRRHAYCVSVVPLLTAGCVPAFSQGCPPAPSMPIKMEKEERRASPKAAEAHSRSRSLLLFDSFKKVAAQNLPRSEVPRAVN